MKEYFQNIKNAFRIVSPQKSILLIAKTGQEKYHWITLIENAINKQIDIRLRWINKEIKELETYHETARISKFIGRIFQPKSHQFKKLKCPWCFGAIN